MAKDFMNYGAMVQDALRGVVRQALARVAAQGLPGNHHLSLSFKTNLPGVEIPDYLRERFPDEMTIILQHQFWGLKVTDDGFEVGLSFNKMPEMLHIPFAALTAFFDHWVRFGLQFQPSEDEAAEPRPVPAEPAILAAKREETAAEDKPAEDKPDAEPRGQVLTLDAFRKK